MTALELMKWVSENPTRAITIRNSLKKPDTLHICVEGSCNDGWGYIVYGECLYTNLLEDDVKILIGYVEKAERVSHNDLRPSNCDT